MCSVCAIIQRREREFCSCGGALIPLNSYGRRLNYENQQGTNRRTSLRGKKKRVSGVVDCVTGFLFRPLASALTNSRRTADRPTDRPTGQVKQNKTKHIKTLERKEDVCKRRKRRRRREKDDEKEMKQKVREEAGPAQVHRHPSQIWTGGRRQEEGPQLDFYIELNFFLKLQAVRTNERDKMVVMMMQVGTVRQRRLPSVCIIVWPGQKMLQHANYLCLPPFLPACLTLSFGAHDFQFF